MPEVSELPWDAPSLSPIRHWRLNYFRLHLPRQKSSLTPFYFSADVYLAKNPAIALSAATDQMAPTWFFPATGTKSLSVEPAAAKSARPWSIGTISSAVP